MSHENDPTLNKKKTAFFQTTDPTDLPLAAEETQEVVRSDTNPLERLVPWVLEFRIIGTPTIIRPPSRDVMLIGRSDSHQEVFADIDLGEHDGQALGVSRRHALLLTRDNRLMIQDLASSNGTFINGRRLVANDAYRLRDGDRLRLGQLELQVHLVVKPLQSDDTVIGFQNLMKIPKIATGQHLLILDENTDVCRVIHYVALRAGFQVVTAHDGAEALRHIDHHLPDAFITELMLPDMNCADVIQYLRQKAASKTIPIVVMSGNASSYRMGQITTLGIDLVLGKPLALDELTNSLGKLIAKITPSA